MMNSDKNVYESEENENVKYKHAEQYNEVKRSHSLLKGLKGNV